MELRRCSRPEFAEELHSVVRTPLSFPSIGKSQRLFVIDRFKVKVSLVRLTRDPVDIHG